MRWIAYTLLASFLGAGALVASARSRTPEPLPPPPAESQESEEQEEDFIPTEKVPADSAISFPVDI